MMTAREYHGQPQSKYCSLESPPQVFGPQKESTQGCGYDLTVIPRVAKGLAGLSENYITLHLKQTGKGHGHGAQKTVSLPTFLI